MIAPSNLRHARQALVLSTILGLHVAIFWLIATGLAPRLLQSLVPDPPPVMVLPRAEERLVVAKPGATAAVEHQPTRVARPIVEIPDFEDAVPKIVDPMADETTGGRVDGPVAEPFAPPGLRTRDRRVAALVDSCYPAASRRLGEQGRAIAQLTIGADGRVRNWHIGQSTGYSRLDAALGCVIERLEFEAGRHAGRPVEAEAELPIAFRLE